MSLADTLPQMHQRKITKGDHRRLSGLCWNELLLAELSEPRAFQLTYRRVSFLQLSPGSIPS